MTPKWDASLLTFDPDGHRYTYDGKPVPSVTQIIEACGIVKPYDGDPWFGERGTAVHLACEMVDEGTLNWETLDPQLMPYVNGYSYWLEESAFKVVHSEMPVANPDLGYAGTLDRIGELDGRTVILDIKTGQRQRATGVQLALYATCFKWGAEFVGCFKIEDMPPRYALHLSATEPAKLVEYADPLDYDAARAAAMLARWRAAGRKKPRPLRP